MANQERHFLLDLALSWESTPLRFSFELPLIHNCGFSRTHSFSFALMLPTGIYSSRVLGNRFVLATAESLFLFAVSIPRGYFHHSGQGHVSSSTELQVELSVLNALLEGTNCLVL